MTRSATGVATVPLWFTGREAVTRFLAERAFAGPGDLVLIPTAANVGSPRSPSFSNQRCSPLSTRRAERSGS